MAFKGKTDAGTAVAERTPGQVAILNQLSELMHDIPDAGGDGLGILENILAAESPEDLLGERQGTVPIEDMFDSELLIHRISKVESSYLGQPGQIFEHFMVLEGRNLATGSDFVSTTSGATVMVTLAKLRQFGVFPVVVRITQSKTNNNFDVQNISVLNYSKDTVDA